MVNQIAPYKQNIISDKKLIIIVSSQILSNEELSFNEKLILALDFTLSKKKGYNQLSNARVGLLLHLHPNIVSYCRKNLVTLGYLQKQRSKFILTEKYKEITVSDLRNIILPFEIYNSKMNTGAKLLWGEYNSMKKGKRAYFASREYSANRLNSSVESISNWTKQLNKMDFLRHYEVISGYEKKVKIVMTKEF